MLPDAGIFCLADGMGGVEGGAVASQQTLKIVSDSLGANPRILTFAEKIKRIKQALLDANRWIRNWAASRGSKGSGTTFVGLILDFAGRGRSTFLHAGDSRGYCFRKGTLRQITRDHSIATVFGAHRIETVPAMFKNVIMNAIGTQETFSLEKTPAALETGDLFLLCSDGLTTMLQDSEIARILNEQADAELDAIARALVQAANDAGGLDNTSVILVKILAPLRSETDSHEERVTDTHDGLLDANTLSPGDRPAGETHADPPSTENSEILARSPGDEEPTFVHNRTSNGMRRYLTGAIGLVVLVALAAALVRQMRKGAEAERTRDLLVTNAVLRPGNATFQTTADHSVTVSAAPTLTDEELTTLLSEHVESGRLGELDARLRQDAGLLGQLKANRKNFDAFSGWFSEWSRNFNAPDAVPVEFHSYLETAHKLSRLLDVEVLDEPDVSWPADPAERANLNCRLMNRQQNHFTDAALRFMDQLESELTALGDDPDLVLTILETTAAQPGLKETVAVIKTATADFRRWIARSRARPISGNDLERVAVPFASDLQDHMRQLREEIWSRVMALSPESLRTVMASDEVPAFLEIKRRNLASLSGRDAKAVWTEKESRSRLQTILRYLCMAAGRKASIGPEAAK